MRHGSGSLHAFLPCQASSLSLDTRHRLARDVQCFALHFCTVGADTLSLHAFGAFPILTSSFLVLVLALASLEPPLECFS